MDNDSLPEHQAQKEEAPKVEKRSGSSGWMWLLVFVVIVLIGLFIGYLLWQYVDQNETAIKSNAQTLTEQSDQISSLKQALSTQDNSIQSQKQFIQDNQASIGRVMSSLGSRQAMWMVGEAEHYIRLANITLKFEHNIQSTILLLKAADKSLYIAADPDLYSVREILASDIAQLQAAPKIDTAGLYLQLKALKQQTLKLTLVQSKFTGALDNKNLVNQKVEGDSFWHKALNESSNALSKVLVVRDRTHNINPLITPREHMVLDQNIYLMFSQAQWAVLHRNEKIYNSSLTTLIKWIGQYYVGNNASIQMINTLRKMQAQDIAPPLPDVSNALTALQKYEKLKVKKSLLKVSKKMKSVKRKKSINSKKTKPAGKQAS
jgi:uroporphyrin-III C-methyltransferase